MSSSDGGWASPQRAPGRHKWNWGKAATDENGFFSMDAHTDTKRTVTNVAVLFVGKTEASYDATLTAATVAKVAAFTADFGIASSNGGPLLGVNPPLPLNDLIGVDVKQTFVLDVDRAGVADELARLYDVVLYVEYTAAFI